jgi:hypothetical protein
MKDRPHSRDVRTRTAPFAPDEPPPMSVIPASAVRWTLRFAAASLRSRRACRAVIPI